MDSFAEWIRSSDLPCFQEWGEKAIALGASWESFRREQAETIVQDLVQGGVPILAARDMTQLAIAEVEKSLAPMAVFWDLENMPIPSATSGRDITSSLKSILAPHGDLIQFRGYASIGLNHIPPEKRSDLQLSGCHLVDCPHQGRKEVADKMIIVDAMQFAFQHPKGAALCFITGDVDYAYLLATLQRPQWRTIVISRGTMQSMLDVNCDMKMRWETDILRPIYSAADNDESVSPEQARETVSTDPKPNPFRPLSEDEGWKDDVELLRNVMKQQGTTHGTLAPRKSLIGNLLRATNPARFPQREAIKSFLARAIEERVVIEDGDGAFKTLCFPMNVGKINHQPQLPVTRILPRSLLRLPSKVVGMANTFPFVVVLHKKYCRSGSTPPPKVFVQTSQDWLFYQFFGQSLVNKAVASCPWLYQGSLLDLRQDYSTAVSQKRCSVCDGVVVETLAGSDVEKQPDRCKDCVELELQAKETASLGVANVVATMNFLALNDDIIVPVNTLAKWISLRHPTVCSSTALAKLWILEAEKRNSIKVTRTPMKQPSAILPSYFRSMPSTKTKIDTTKQENFVYDLLWEVSDLGIDRKTVNQRLEEEFENMDSPLRRHQVFSNAHSKRTFFIAKGPFHQTVALTFEQAQEALKALSSDDLTQKEEKEPPSVEEGNDSVDLETHSDDLSSTSNDSDEEMDISAIVSGVHSS